MSEAAAKAKRQPPWSLTLGRPRKAIQTDIGQTPRASAVSATLKFTHLHAHAVDRITSVSLRAE